MNSGGDTEPSSNAADDTPLGLELKALIAGQGPITVADYMRHCLFDPVHGYYRVRTGIGAAGDFVTAPEISQVFGEVIGGWCAVVWHQLGRPSPFRLVELGPGRGTLMADIVRATRRVAGFAEAAEILLVEPSPALAQQQQKTLADVVSSGQVRIGWQSDLASVAASGPAGGPTILVANEVLDCFPIRQLTATSEGWRERVVELDHAGRLAFADGPVVSIGLPLTEPRAVVEIRDFDALKSDLHAIQPLVALFIDYGHANPAFGDTLQAIREHQTVAPLERPGLCDLTAQVDFSAFAAAMSRPPGFVVDGPVTQTSFLGALGALERASRLMASRPDLAPVIEAQVARLMGPAAMGGRFKVVAVRSPGLPVPPGFETMARSAAP